MGKGSLVGNTGMDRLWDKKKAGRVSRVEVFEYSLWGKKTISEIKKLKLMHWIDEVSQVYRHVWERDAGKIWDIVNAAWSPL